MSKAYHIVEETLVEALGQKEADKLISFHQKKVQEKAEAREAERQARKAEYDNRKAEAAKSGIVKVCGADIIKANHKVDAVKAEITSAVVAKTTNRPAWFVGAGLYHDSNSNNVLYVSSYGTSRSRTYAVSALNDKGIEIAKSELKSAGIKAKGVSFE